MTKKKLLMVVGAGASIEFGMPCVKQAGDIINAKAQDSFPLADRPHTNLYKYIEERVKRRWKKHVPKHLRRDPQFEDILYAIFGLASAYPAYAYTSALGALISAKKLPDISVPDALCGARRTVVDRYQIGHLGAFAVDALLSEFRRLCKASEQEKTAEFARLLSFLTTLQKKLGPACYIYTGQCIGSSRCLLKMVQQVPLVESYAARFFLPMGWSASSAC